jgi:hypothetical protein
MTSSVAAVNTNIADMLCPPNTFNRTACSCRNSTSASSACYSTIQFTNMDAGVAACDDGNGGGILASATPGKLRLVLMITDGVRAAV